jgi:predicted small secreted protein
VDTKRPPLLPLAVVLAWLGLAGCGTTTTVGTGRTLQIALNEYRVTPQSVRAQTGPLTIFVHNYGRLTHDLVISLDGRTEAATTPIAPGQTQELDAALAPGRYLMASSVLSDQALGAYGSLTVH